MRNCAKYTEYCFNLMYDNKAYLSGRNKQGEKGRQERIKWAAATMGCVKYLVGRL